MGGELGKKGRTRCLFGMKENVFLGNAFLENVFQFNVIRTYLLKLDNSISKLDSTSI